VAEVIVQKCLQDISDETVFYNFFVFLFFFFFSFFLRSVMGEDG